MRNSNILLLLSLTLCSSSYAEDALTNRAGVSATNEIDVGVVITSAQAGRPIVVGIERKKYPKPPYESVADRGDTSYFFSSPAWGTTLDLSKPVVRQWQTNYFLFSQALVSAAQKAHLDSSSLEKILQQIRVAPENKNLAVLPVAAHSTIRDGELVWVVALRWEIERWAGEGEDLGHIRQFIVTQKTLKQVDFNTCG